MDASNIIAVQDYGNSMLDGDTPELFYKQKPHFS